MRIGYICNTLSKVNFFKNTKAVEALRVYGSVFSLTNYNNALKILTKINVFKVKEAKLIASLGRANKCVYKSNSAAAEATKDDTYPYRRVANSIIYHY